MYLEPTSVYRIPLPDPVVAFIGIRYPKILTSNDPEHTYPLDFISGMAALHFDNTTWLVMDQKMVALSPHPSNCKSEYSLPRKEEVLASIGHSEGEDFGVFPAYRLPDNRQMWLAFGYVEDNGSIAIPLIFDPYGKETWTVLKPKDEIIQGWMLGGGLRKSDAENKIILHGSYHSDINSHYEYEGTTEVAYECDLKEKTYSRIRDPYLTNYLPYPFHILTAHEHYWFCLKDLDYLIRFNTLTKKRKVLENLYGEKRLPLILTDAPPEKFDLRTGSDLCRSYKLNNQGLALSFFSKTHATVSFWDCIDATLRT